MSCNIKGIINKKLEVNNNLHNKYKIKQVLDKGLSDGKLYIVSHKNKKYIVKVGEKKLIYPEIYFYCLFKGNENIPKIIDYGECNSENPFENKESDNKEILKNEFYFMIIEYIEGYSLRDAIMYKKINIKQCKIMLKNVIKTYSKLNKKFNFKWGDLHLENLLFDKKKKKIMIIDLQSGINNKYKIKDNFRFLMVYMKYILKLTKKELNDLTKIVKIYDRKTGTLKNSPKSLLKTYDKLNSMNKSFIKDLSFVKIDYTTVAPVFIKYLDADRTREYYMNLSEYDKQLHKINIYSSDWYLYDIFAILKIINFSERNLSNGDKQILLNNKDVKYLNNKKISFNKKLDYIINMKYFNSSRTVKK
tara:strand:- start:2157 stop:3239 length:1083 start_codon:yes stop_codon:yes gene_type:complete